MTLLNNEFIKLDGEPVTGRTPTQRIVHAPPGYVLDSALGGLIEAEYRSFTRWCKLSVSPFQVKQKRLPDGTVIRMESIQGKDRVQVWPAGASPAVGAIFYWLQTFEHASAYKKEDETDVDKVITEPRKLKRLSVFPADTESPVFTRCVSPDGMLEIWVQESVTAKHYKRAAVVPVLADADEDPADADGTHEHEVSVWFYREEYDTRVPLPCENDGGSVVGYGNPYHGMIEGEVLTSAHGEVPVTAPEYPFTWMVKFAGVPEVSESVALDWKNYAILSGSERVYFPVKDFELKIGINTQLYRTNDGKVYVVSMYMVNALRLVVWATQAAVDPASVTPVILYDGTLSYTRYPDDPTGPTPPYHVGRTNFSPDGTRFCINISRVIWDTGAQEHSLDHRAGVCVAVFECVLSGGGASEAALSCTVTKKANYLQVASDVLTTTPTSTYACLGTPTETTTVTEDATWIHTRRVTTPVIVDSGVPFSENYTHTVTAKQLLGGVYGDDNELQVIEKEAAYAATKSCSETNTYDTTPWDRTTHYYKPTGVQTITEDSQTADAALVGSITFVQSGSIKVLSNGTAKYQQVFSGGTVSTRNITLTVPATLVSASSTSGSYLVDGDTHAVSESDNYTDTSSAYRVHGPTVLAAMPTTSVGPVMYDLVLSKYNDTLLASNNVIVVPGENLTTFTPDMTVRHVVTPNGLREETVLYADISTGETSGGKDLVWISWNPATDEVALGSETSWA